MTVGTRKSQCRIGRVKYKNGVISIPQPQAKNHINEYARECFNEFINEPLSGFCFISWRKKDDASAVFYHSPTGEQWLLPAMVEERVRYQITKQTME